MTEDPQKNLRIDLHYDLHICRSEGNETHVYCNTISTNQIIETMTSGQLPINRFRKSYEHVHTCVHVHTDNKDLLLKQKEK